MKNNQDAASSTGSSRNDRTSAYKHISIDEIDVHLVIAKFVTSLKRSQKCQFELILNLINEKRMNDLSQRMDVNEKNDDDKMNCDDK